MSAAIPPSALILCPCMLTLLPQVVSANTEYTKKARKFQKKLSSLRPDLTVSYAVFMRSDAENTTDKGSVLEIEGNVRGKDVILIEDYIGKPLTAVAALTAALCVLVYVVA